MAVERWVDGTVLSTPMPDWFRGWRDHQIDAVNEAVDALSECRMVLIDAPTGSGKTVIGETVGRLVTGRRLYVCHGLELQDQFARDFTAPVLKGRSNYPTVRGGWETTADECRGKMCPLCPSRGDCPYEQAKQAAIQGSPAVLNTAYYLTEGNGPGRMKGRGLVVVDEADTLESELLRWAEFRATDFGVRRYGLKLPVKGAHWPTVMAFMEEYRAALIDEARQLEYTDPKQARISVARAQSIDRNFMGLDVDPDNWVREYPWQPKGRPTPLVLKPVRVDGYGRDHLWNLGRNHLLMSATLIGPGFMLRDLGFDEDFHTVEVPMTFPVENRPIYVAPVATMTKKGKEAGEWEHMVTAVLKVMGQHPKERILVHTVSYDLTRELYERCGGGYLGRGITYRDRDGRRRALEEFKQTEGGVLFAPSMDRGIDLPDDLCRVQVVAKLPYPYLGDPRVNARMHSEGGQTWYDLQTVRALVQMTGRGVRSADDWCVSYILDRSFVKNFTKYRPLLPKWWREAVVLNRSADEVVNGDPSRAMQAGVS